MIDKEECTCPSCMLTQVHDLIASLGQAFSDTYFSREDYKTSQVLILFVMVQAQVLILKDHVDEFLGKPHVKIDITIN